MKIHSHLKALYYFLITARHLSIKEASESLFVTQAAISQQIRLLEEFLGVALFHRKHRSLVLTEEGSQLLPHLEVAFAAIEKGVNELALDNDPDTLVLSVFPSFASRWLIPRLGSFYKLNPSITINLSMTDKYEAFGAQGIDLAIRFGSGVYDDIESQLLMKDFIYPVCHPVYAKENNIRVVEDLKRLRLLDDTVSNISWDYWFDKKGLAEMFGSEGASDSDADKFSRVRYDGSHYVVDSALSSQGVAMARHSLVSESIAHQQLVRLFDEPVELESQFFLCAPKHHFKFSKVQLFSEWLLKEVDDFCRRHPI